ncbi:MAG: response regulator [Thermoanaerobaculales bacterium]|jgi:CheY-like chemotaxis protein|nr:response regulator [Thermoanaerobaculales bacterium]
MTKKILIIDDEKDMRVYLEAVFRKAGYETETAADGDQGVWLAEAQQPDLITLDVLMPKKSGVKAYRSLRTSEKTAAIPIIVLTGLTRSDDFFGDFGELRKPEAVVEKPIKREEFLETVKELIGAD